MINQLEAIAYSLSMAWGFGTLAELETFALEHTGDYLLWHEGYLNADLGTDAQNNLEYSHNLVLDIILPSAVTDAPEERAQRIDALNSRARSVYKKLQGLGEIRRANIATGLNMTSTGLDALQLTVVLKTAALSLCQP